METEVDNQRFEQLLATQDPGISSQAIATIVKYRELVLRENEVQNLTRLISPEDFLRGHVLDAMELVKSGLVEFPAVDMGSGAGVPGILCSILAPGTWTLSESEGRKADFLLRTVSELKLSAVSVAKGRTEEHLLENACSSIVVRAVGPVERLYRQLMKCSTWNSMILLKGPSWKNEWAEFRRTKYRDDLSISADHIYAVGEGQARRERRIVKLLRNVPRRT